MALQYEIHLICDSCGHRHSLTATVELAGGLLLRTSALPRGVQVTQTRDVNWNCPRCFANQNGDVFGPPRPEEIQRAMQRMNRHSDRTGQFRQEYPATPVRNPRQRTTTVEYVAESDHYRGVFEKKKIQVRTLSDRELAELDGEPLPDPVEGGRAERLKARKQPLED